MAVLKSSGDAERDKEDKVLPRAQQHALRETLFAGVADQRFALVRERYEVNWRAFGTRTSLFFNKEGREATAARANAPACSMRWS